MALPPLSCCLQQQSSAVCYHSLWLDGQLVVFHLSSITRGRPVLQVHYILGELCFGGLALETNMAEILSHLDEQNRLEKQEVIVRSIDQLIMVGLTKQSLPPVVHSVLFCPLYFCFVLPMFFSCYGMLIVLKFNPTLLRLECLECPCIRSLLCFYSFSLCSKKSCRTE